jgi:hypothetical protein
MLRVAHRVRESAECSMVKVLRSYTTSKSVSFFSKREIAQLTFDAEGTATGDCIASEKAD